MTQVDLNVVATVCLRSLLRATGDKVFQETSKAHLRTYRIQAERRSTEEVRGFAKRLAADVVRHVTATRIRAFGWSKATPKAPNPLVCRVASGARRVKVIAYAYRNDPDATVYVRVLYMWGKLRDWLGHGSIDDDSRLEQDVTGPGYQHDRQDRLVLEAKEKMKRRGLDSPDDGDALALTFAAPVLTRAQKKHRRVRRSPFQGRRVPGNSTGLEWLR